MRRILIFLAWSGVVGAICDGAITVYAAWEVVSRDDMGIGLTVDQHVKEHLHFLYWLKDLAYILMPNDFVDWLFGLPALAYFPVRILINVLLGYWMFRWANKLP